MAAIVLVTVSSYVPLTVLITERRGKARAPTRPQSRAGPSAKLEREPRSIKQAADPHTAVNTLAPCHSAEPHLTPPLLCPPHTQTHSPRPPLPTQVRKVMNNLDSEREGRATDVLLNYETASRGPLVQPAGSRGKSTGRELEGLPCGEQTWFAGVRPHPCCQNRALPWPSPLPNLGLNTLPSRPFTTINRSSTLATRVLSCPATTLRRASTRQGAVCGAGVYLVGLMSRLSWVCCDAQGEIPGTPLQGGGR